MSRFCTRRYRMTTRPGAAFSGRPGLHVTPFHHDLTILLHGPSSAQETSGWRSGHSGIYNHRHCFTEVARPHTPGLRAFPPCRVVLDCVLEPANPFLPLLWHSCGGPIFGSVDTISGWPTTFSNFPRIMILGEHLITDIKMTIIS